MWQNEFGRAGIHGCHAYHLYALLQSLRAWGSVQQLRDDDDLPFVSRQNNAAAKAARGAIAKPMKMTSGATTSYNEAEDDELDAELSNVKTKLAGV